MLSVRIGLCELVIVPTTEAVVSDGQILEEDTHLVLSAPAVIPERREHPIKVMEAIWNDEPHEPGTVVVQGRRLLAVVHDLSLEPSTNKIWVASAMDAALAAAGERGMAHVSVPLLGAVHGRLPIAEVYAAISEAVWRMGKSPVRKVTLLADERHLAELEPLLG